MSQPTAQLDTAGEPSGTVRASRLQRTTRLLAHFGPAFVASIAYIDPGNFATNFDGGARFGYKLLWVLLWSNAMAVLIQYQSAKLGIVSGRTLPQLIGDRHPNRPRRQVAQDP